MVPEKNKIVPKYSLEAATFCALGEAVTLQVQPPTRIQKEELFQKPIQQS